ncbi:zinc finger, CCHC-type containing protein [Tanacetum coccineum]
MDVAAMKHMTSNFAKLDKFEGVDFIRWQKKMHFLLSSMSVVYVLTTPIPEDGGDDATVEQIRKRNKWDNDDYNSLEAKYMVENASSKKFLVSNFTNYEMTDSRQFLEQYNELLGILERFTQHKINIDESIQASCIIDKPSLSWKDFKHTLKSLKEELTLVELDSHLRIEESLRVQDNDKPKSNNVAGPQAVVRLPDPKLKTLGERGIECIFVGYAKHSKAFRSLVKGTEDSGGSVVFERVTDEIDEVSDQHSYYFNVEDDPKTFKEAMKSQDVAFWQEAINDEMDSIIGNNTWVLTDLPPDCRPLGCKWIFKRKMKVDGTVEKFKASLIIHQMDVKTTFLNGELEEEVYMNQPLGFNLPGNENKVYKLVKSLYGLKHAPKQWHQKFDKVVLSNGYLLNQADNVDLTKEFLSSRFSMKNMGEADVILGIRIKHESNGIAISQSHYIKKVLKKFNYSYCTLVSTPLDTYVKLMPNRGLAVSQLKYSRVIGCLMYAMTCTRPDIAFAIGKQSTYTSNPDTQHWQVIQRVLKYLKKIMDYRLVYSGYPSVLEGCIDASWISNTKDNSSTSGWVFLLGGGAISWASKKQTCITGSIMEFEFVALAATGKEAEWLKNLLLEIPPWVKPMAPIFIRCDSAAILTKAYSQMYNRKSRHLGVRHSMVRELITNRVVSIEFVRSQQNLADHLTKDLARDLVIKSAKGIGLKSNQVAEC